MSQSLLAQQLPRLMWLTDFGDAAIILPMAAIIAIWLLLARPRPLSMWWCFCFCGSAISVWLAKLIFATAPVVIGSFSLRSPSGHACTSATLYGMIAIIFNVSSTNLLRPVTIALMAAVVGGVTLSRVVLQMHSLSDALAGALIGLLWLTPMALTMKPYRAGKYAHGLLAIFLLLTAAITHGASLPIYRTNLIPISSHTGT